MADRMIDLNAIAARLAETTGAPWQRHGADVHSAAGILFRGKDGSAAIRQQADADADFVAHAPADVADLLSEIERLQQATPTSAATQTPSAQPTGDLAARIGALLLDRGEQMAVAESLTGGRLSAELARTQDASKWLRGAVVAYQVEVKQKMLDVAPGPVVTRSAAEQMADGVAALLGAELAVSVTGVGGPDPSEGQPAGTVWMAVRYRDNTVAQLVHLSGEPDRICEETCRTVLAFALQRMM